MHSKPLLETEQRNPRTTHIDTMPVSEILSVIAAENTAAAKAVEDAIVQIVPVAEHVAHLMERGGRLIYVGAGTSGRIGVMDAAECPPTFGVDNGTVVGVVAGGAAAMMSADAGCEDDTEQGKADLLALSICEKDTVMGLSAAGAAPYVLGAMQAAKDAGAYIVSLCCNPDTPMQRLADGVIYVHTGPEAVTGSTRMKAGSAQKAVLNMLSTCVMIKLGKVYENYMVGVRPTNEKLRARAQTTVSALTGCTTAEAEAALKKHGDVRGAVESIKTGGTCR